MKNFFFGPRSKKFISLNHSVIQGYIFWPYLSKLKNREEKSDKTHVRIYLYEAEMTAKNPQKQGRILEGGGRIFLAGQNIYP